MSDLHLEVGQQYAHFAIPPKAPYLVLAGDIGRLIDYAPLRDFLATQCSKFETVFYVLGNHEFYGTSRTEGLRTVVKLQEEPIMRGKLCVMNRIRYDIDNHTIVLGCTLQSNITPETRDTIEMKIQDFSKIDNWTVNDHNAERTCNPKFHLRCASHLPYSETACAQPISSSNSLESKLRWQTHLWHARSQSSRLKAFPSYFSYKSFWNPSSLVLLKLW